MVVVRSKEVCCTPNNRTSHDLAYLLTRRVRESRSRVTAYKHLQTHPSTTTMNTLVSKFSNTSYDEELRRTQDELEDEGLSGAMWGSGAGFGNLSKGLPTFNLPCVPDVRTSNA